MGVAGTGRLLTRLGSPARVPARLPRPPGCLGRPPFCGVFISYLRENIYSYHESVINRLFVITIYILYTSCDLKPDLKVPSTSLSLSRTIRRLNPSSLRARRMRANASFAEHVTPTTYCPVVAGRSPPVGHNNVRGRGPSL